MLWRSLESWPQSLFRWPFQWGKCLSKPGCQFPMFFPWSPQNGWNKGKPLGIKGQGSYGMFILISFQASVVLRGPWNHLPFMSCGGGVWLQGMVLNRPHTRCGHCACTLGRSDLRLTVCAVAQLSIGGTFEVLTRWYQPQQIAYKCLQNIYIYIIYTPDMGIICGFDLRNTFHELVL